MSWGERSCLKPCRFEANCTMENCNVDCPAYKWDGVTKPDSTPCTVSDATTASINSIIDTHANATTNIFNPVKKKSKMNDEDAKWFKKVRADRKKAKKHRKKFKR